jgi:hypothetical protein
MQPLRVGCRCCRDRPVDRFNENNAWKNGAASGSGAIDCQTACIRHLLYARPSASLRRHRMKRPVMAKPIPNRPAGPGSGTTFEVPVSVAVP